MSDNTMLPGGVGGDTLRDIDRSVNLVPIQAKTQVMQIDAGGESGESLVSPQNPMPTQDSGSRINVFLTMQTLLLAQAAPQNGFTPMETPSFLGGF